MGEIAWALFIPGSQDHRRACMGIVGINVGLRARPGLAPLPTPPSPTL